MRAEKIERRNNRRVFFLKNNDLNAQLKPLSWVDSHFQARVKDISLAGIGFVLERTQPVIVSLGDRFLITSIQEANAVHFLTRTTLEVEWVVDTDMLDHIGFGCSFLNLDSVTQATLDEYIIAST